MNRDAWGEHTAEKPAYRPAIPKAADIYRWIYVSRLSLALVVFVAASVYFKGLPSAILVLLSVAAVLTVLVSAASVWYTDILKRSPGTTFRYVQAIFDTMLVTAVVHATGGTESTFLSLYILVVAVTALLLPVYSVLLLTLFAAILYMADVVLSYPEQLSLAVLFQGVVFIGVALVAGWLTSRVRVAHAEKEELERQVHRLRLEAGDILHHIRTGIVTIDGSGRLIYANPAAEDLLDFRAAHYIDIDRSFGDLVEQRSPRMWELVRRTHREGQPFQGVEAPVKTPAREFELGVTTTGFAIDDAEGRSVTAIFTDISGKKAMEQLKMRNERLEAVAALSASLAHEIKNPLASIRSSVEQLAESVRSGDDEKLLAGLVVRESDRLSRLLNEFLDFSRVRVTRRRRLDLESVVRAAVGIVRKHPACVDGMTVRLETKPVELEGDEDLLHRVVFNLVLNAVQACQGRGTVTVEVREAAYHELPRGVSLESPVLLRVSDDGPGIPEAIIDRLFEPFVTGRTEGSGLGLAIVQRAVEAHSGIILIDSEAGGGTRLTVLLPATAVSEGAT